MKTYIEAKNLVKKFGSRVVVNGLSLEVQAGECFGLLGPNGAGKSTTLKMMYGTAAITEGELFILGLNAKTSSREIKSRIGVIPQEDGLDREFSVYENLYTYANYFGLDSVVIKARLDELLRLVRLEEEKNQPVYQLSGGMRRRLAIARGLVNHPEVLFLDEPTTGLDPQARIWIWEFLKKIQVEMGTIVMTTHYMEEAQTLCDRVALINKGQIIAIGKPADLISKEIGEEVFEFYCATQDISYYVSRLQEQNLPYQVYGQTIVIFLKNKESSKNFIQTIESKKMMLRQANLNDVFLKLTGQELGEVE